MKVEDFSAELESDLEWRQAEVLFFQNVSSGIRDTDLQRYLKSLVLVVYAHVEGYVKFSLSSYVRAINSQMLSCNDANDAIVAASLSDLLSALRDAQRKSKDFSKAPDDAALQQFCRDREFVSKSRDFFSMTVKIPDSAVNTESNLWPIVLRKNLYRLGLPHDRLSHLDGALSRLVNTRNEIGHGSRRDGVEWKDYLELRNAAFKVMQDITSCLFTAYSLAWYKKQALA
jgi:hypothetical protein